VISVVALMIGALIALSVAASSGGSDTNRANSNPFGTLTHSPVLLRPVLCLAPAYAPQQKASGPLPPCALPYQQTAANLDFTPYSATKGYSSNNIGPDPALASYPNSVQDSSKLTVLIGGLKGSEPVSQRFVLGPSEMRMSATDVESASAERNPAGQWMVDVHLSSVGSKDFDRVIEKNFHRLLGIDIGGRVVNASVIEPTQSSFSSMDGRLSIAGNLSAANARIIATAIKG
jgi:hypothetical protein